ncbi:MAG TPA: response regulator [Candidatus Paceibacterota bacterium]|nr:response regulator [Candidatus Paceibacterota bacterium]
MKILIVDDNGDLRLLIKNALASFFGETVEIREASTVSEARLALADFPPDVVFSDVNIGNDFGPDLVPDFRARSPHALVCLMSGKAEPPNHGADRFFPKPVKIASFRNAVLEAGTRAA